MGNKKILFVSWQGGLGHITRDLAIANEIHRKNPEVEIFWLAHPLACRVLREAGESLLPESEHSCDYNQAGISALKGFSLNITRYFLLIKKAYAHNVGLFKRAIASFQFDLVIGDESYEILDSLVGNNVQMESRFIMIHDFLGMEAMTHNPLEKLIVFRRNWLRAKKMPRVPDSRLTHFFVGQPEDVPDRRFGFLLPNRREFARKYFHFLGYIIRFDPAVYADREKVRRRLGYGKGPLVVCATGGTSAGMELIELCGKAYPMIKDSIPDLQMTCVHGELFGRQPPSLPPGIAVHRYIPDLYEHYAACDLAVVVGGGSTTIELTALRRPFIYFPLEKQYDQQLYIADRLARNGAGIRMHFRGTTPETLAEAILANIAKEADWPPIPIGGAQKAADILSRFL